MAIWLGGLERWYLVLGGVAVGRGFEPQSDLELSFAKILIHRSLKPCVIESLFRVPWPPDIGAHALLTQHNIDFQHSAFLCRSALKVCVKNFQNFENGCQGRAMHFSICHVDIKMARL
jgi:hypothetical protein